jgi:hypothetical protein
MDLQSDIVLLRLSCQSPIPSNDYQDCQTFISEITYNSSDFLTKPVQNPGFVTKPVVKKYLQRLTNYIIIDDISVATEDLGKIFEMAICILFDTPFEGKYKYSIEEANKLTTRIQPLLLVFPHKIKHTAKNGSQYDFTGIDNSEIKLSAKTTKKDGKICPQIIGQPTKKKFCEYFNLDILVSSNEIKTFIETNISNMLYKYFELTFDCPIIYYNQKKDTVKLIYIFDKIDWQKYTIEFSHIKKNKIWNESTTIYINKTPIGEFQIHNHRDCIKFRWAFENLLKLFENTFNITNL